MDCLLNLVFNGAHLWCIYGVRSMQPQSSSESLDAFPFCFEVTKRTTSSFIQELQKLQKLQKPFRNLRWCLRCSNVFVTTPISSW